MVVVVVTVEAAAEWFWREGAAERCRVREGRRCRGERKGPTWIVASCRGSASVLV